MMGLGQGDMGQGDRFIVPFFCGWAMVPVPVTHPWIGSDRCNQRFFLRVGHRFFTEKGFDKLKGLVEDPGFHLYRLKMEIIRQVERIFKKWSVFRGFGMKNGKVVCILKIWNEYLRKWIE